MEAALNKLLNNRSVFHRFLILFWPFFGVWPFSHPFSSKASFCCHVANALAPCEPFLPRTRFGTGSTCCAVTCNWLDSQPYWKARYVSPANHIKFSTVMLCQRIDESAGRAPHSSNGRKAVACGQKILHEKQTKTWWRFCVGWQRGRGAKQASRKHRVLGRRAVAKII